MAKLVQLEAGVFVAPQLVESDFEEIAAKGFRWVVNNRPDGEAEGQLANWRAAAEAKRHGLGFIYQPVPNLRVTETDVVEAFSTALDSLERPVLFYCRSGTRCTILWAQASAPRLGVDEVIAIAANAGYDLEGIRDTIAEWAARAAEAS